MQDHIQVTYKSHTSQEWRSLPPSPQEFRLAESFIPVHSFTPPWTGVMVNKSGACGSLQVVSSLLATFTQAVKPHRWHFRYELVSVNKGVRSPWVAGCLGLFLVGPRALSVPRQACVSLSWTVFARMSQVLWAQVLHTSCRALILGWVFYGFMMFHFKRKIWNRKKWSETNNPRLVQSRVANKGTVTLLELMRSSQGQ